VTSFVLNALCMMRTLRAYLLARILCCYLREMNVIRSRPTTGISLPGGVNARYEVITAVSKDNTFWGMMSSLVHGC